MERREYTAETYPSFGKKYNGEKAIISLTSWRARINTVAKTLYSLVKQCPGFHIVLVLSEEEFPKMMDELPETLKLFVDNELIEVLWVYKNYKSLKKWLFTQDKYRDIPIISADDDCIYTCNYAQELYNLWNQDKTKICTINAKSPHNTNGTATLYFPHCFNDLSLQELYTNQYINIYCNADDAFYETLRYKFGLLKSINYLSPHKIWYNQNSIEPLNNIYSKPNYFKKLRSIQSLDIKTNASIIFGS